MKKTFFILLFVLALVFFVGQAVFAYDSASSNYRLEKSSINFSGDDGASSPNFLLRDTLGEVSSGILSGATYQASTGYRYMEADPVSVAVLGCTDSGALNYNSLATVDDGSCSYGGGPNLVWGCTDPLAINYNSSATNDNGSCLYSGVPNVSNFQANYQTETQLIRLTWVNPVYADLATIIIRRGTNSFPLRPTDGVLVYDGVAETTNDANVLPGVRYYYTAFVKSTSGQYSSGAVASEIFTLENDDDEPDDGDDDDEDGGDGGGGGGETFNLLPEASTTLPILSSSWLFRFIQPAERLKVFDRKMTVRVTGSKDLTILFNAKQVPASLKTIGMSITDPYDKNKVFSFLLHINEDGTAYEATIGPLVRAGRYPVDIYVINYDNQTMSRYRGYFVVSSGWSPVVEGIAGVATPVATAGLAFSLYAYLYDILLKAFRLLAYYLGRRRKGEPWGTVYDSVTKQPLDPVYIVAEQAMPNGERKEVASAISDIDGRFGFFLPEGSYYLKANKTHYVFPSKRLEGQESDELYNNLYFGGLITTTGQEVINLNIPMDSVDFDWNEFAKSKSNFFKFYTKRQIWFNRLRDFIFIFGFVFSLTAMVVSPSWWNLVMVVLYLVLYVFNRYWNQRRRPVVIRSRSTNEPLPFSIVRIFMPDINQQIKSVVADKLGRIFVLVRPGAYYYTVEEKKVDGSYQEVFRSSVVSLPKGVLTEDLIVK